MKKLTALIFALALLVSLCACSGQAENMENETASPEPEISNQPVSEEPTQDMEPSEEPSSAPTEDTEAPEPSEEAQPTETVEPASTTADVSTPEPVSTPAPTPEPPAADPKAIAESLIGQSVGELYAAIGQPISSDYAPGCVEPDSEDGELIYSGFTVYTVRTATREYIYDVL